MTNTNESLGKVFELRFGTYEFLRDLDEDPGSYTYKLLQRISKGDLDTYTKCLRKMQEERHEAIAVTQKRHEHDGMDPKETMTNEVEQMTYWPQLLMVGNNIDHKQIGIPEFLNIGFDGTTPDEVNDLIKTGIGDHPQQDLIRIFRSDLIEAGGLLRTFNAELGNEAGIIRPEDIAYYDLEKMKDRDYFTPYFQRQRL